MDALEFAYFLESGQLDKDFSPVISVLEEQNPAVRCDQDSNDR
jgi:hypothetical protein